MKLRVEITVDEAGHLNVGGGAPGLDHVEGVLLQALAYVQRELLAGRVAHQLKTGIVVAGNLPNGLRP